MNARAGLPEGEAMQKAVKFCPERGKLYAVPDEAALVKEIYQTFLRVNSIRKTVDLLNKAGKRNHRGKLWSFKPIYDMLKNPVYVGKVRAGRVSMVNGKPQKTNPSTGLS